MNCPMLDAVSSLATQALISVKEIRSSPRQGNLDYQLSIVETHIKDIIVVAGARPPLNQSRESQMRRTEPK
ncbi:MAG: hypothetical protein HY683_05695 [Chloroflexi bacterium]|nr:hypothetical protein [Chloroflexota bacterium]